LRKILVGLWAAAVVCGGAAPARAEITACTPITSVPVTISVQGVYCLTGDLATSLASGNAITVATNNVTIDLNGWKLGNLAAGPSTLAIGILASNRSNVTIRNGTIRGFAAGIALTGGAATGGHLVEDVRLDGNTLLGVTVSGRGTVVRRNIVVDTGGANPAGPVTGIQASGADHRIVDNDVMDVHAAESQSAGGIRVGSANGVTVAGNSISNVTSISGSRAAIAFGGRGIVRGNEIVGGPGDATAIAVIPDDPHVICASNRAVGYSTVMVNCADGGGNLALP
jgi:hypothetical protein